MGYVNSLSKSKTEHLQKLLDESLSKVKQFDADRKKFEEKAHQELDALKKAATDKYDLTCPSRTCFVLALVRTFFNTDERCCGTNI